MPLLLLCVMLAASGHASRVSQSPPFIPRPSGQEWSLWENDGQTLAYGRHTSQGDNHTVLTFAMLVYPDRAIADSTALLEYVRETQATRSGAGDSQRHKNIDFRASINSDLGPACVREDGVEEDHGVPHAPGSIFVVTSREYYCLHPLSTEASPLLVRLHVSQRYLPGDQPLPIQAEVEPFFRGYLEGSTLPLLRAAKTDDVVAMRALLARGSDVNTRSD